jgi:hypothetical protein
MLPRSQCVVESRQFVGQVAARAPFALTLVGIANSTACSISSRSVRFVPTIMPAEFTTTESAARAKLIAARCARSNASSARWFTTGSVPADSALWGARRDEGGLGLSKKPQSGSRVDCELPTLDKDGHLGHFAMLSRLAATYISHRPYPSPRSITSRPGRVRAQGTIR